MTADSQKWSEAFPKYNLLSQKSDWFQEKNSTNKKDKGVEWCQHSPALIISQPCLQQDLPKPTHDPCAKQQHTLEGNQWAQIHLKLPVDVSIEHLVSSRRSWESCSHWLEASQRGSMEQWAPLSFWYLVISQHGLIWDSAKGRFRRRHTKHHSNIYHFKYLPRKIRNEVFVWIRLLLLNT